MSEKQKVTLVVPMRVIWHVRRGHFNEVAVCCRARRRLLVQNGWYGGRVPAKLWVWWPIHRKIREPQ